MNFKDFWGHVENEEEFKLHTQALKLESDLEWYEIREDRAVIQGYTHWTGDHSYQAIVCSTIFDNEDLER